MNNIAIPTEALEPRLCTNPTDNQRNVYIAHIVHDDRSKSKHQSFRVVCASKQVMEDNKKPDWDTQFTYSRTLHANYTVKLKNIHMYGMFCGLLLELTKETESSDVHYQAHIIRMDNTLNHTEPFTILTMDPDLSVFYADDGHQMKEFMIPQKKK
jgi:hypothetical protein